MKLIFPTVVQTAKFYKLFEFKVLDDILFMNHKQSCQLIPSREVKRFTKMQIASFKFDQNSFQFSNFTFIQLSKVFPSDFVKCCS